MISIKNALAAATIAFATLATNANSAIVSPGGTGITGTLTDLGSFAAGTYQITGGGVVDLMGGGMSINPDGTPSATVTWPQYAEFNPNGSYTASGTFGSAGANAKIGALIGTLIANPSTPNDWFLIGYSKTLTLTATSHIYASVNDTFHQNNTGFFTAAVASVPEPASVILAIAGCIVAATLRNKGAQAKRSEV